MKLGAPILIAVAATAMSPAARAHEEFPSQIAYHLDAPNDPACGLCHLGGKTGSGTVYTPFAWAMRARGLTGEGDTVLPAIDRMRDDGVDSDGDGATDTNEIIDGTDPNAPGTAKNPTDPQLGCSAAGRPLRGGRAAAIVVSLAGGLVAALTGRRRRRRAL
jgi:hypothetical protein